MLMLRSHSWTSYLALALLVRQREVGGLKSGGEFPSYHVPSL